MQEAGTLAGVVFGDEHVRAGWLFGQVARDVGADAGGAFALAAPRRQFELDEAADQPEDEVVIVRGSEADHEVWAVVGRYGHAASQASMRGSYARGRRSSTRCSNSPASIAGTNHKASTEPIPRPASAGPGQ